MADPAFDMIASLGQHLELLGLSGGRSESEKLLEQIRTAPLFSADVKRFVEMLYASPGNPSLFPAFGLLAGRLDDVSRKKQTQISSSDLSLAQVKSSQAMRSIVQEAKPREKEYDPRVFLNVNAPWSAFVCGSQGSGKSHSLACMLECCLIPDPSLGVLPAPLAGLMFHYDSFGGKPCEAATLASAGVDVQVLVSKSNEKTLRSLYESVNENIHVEALQIDDKYLTAGSLMTLMAASTGEGQPLYMYVVMQVLRSLSRANDGEKGIPYQDFKHQIYDKITHPGQREPLELRIQLLEDFVNSSEPTWMYGHKRSRPKQKLAASSCDWSPKGGRLTIVDLSDPFVDSETACGLFEICLDIFMNQEMDVGRVVVLDEAHKFMTDLPAAAKLTERLLQSIREQRHYACRVIVATQEPTVSPKLLDLCTITMVHRFQSPSWYKALKGHLAAVAENEGKGKGGEDDDASDEENDGLFAQIVELDQGDCLLCAPSAILDMEDQVKVRRLGTKSMRVRIRNRITDDGGRSVLAITRPEAPA